MKIKPICLAVSSAMFCSAGFAVAEEKVDGGKLTIYGQDAPTYTALEAPSTTRNDVSIADTSRSIQVLNRDFIEDSEADSLEETLQYISGTANRERLGGVDTQYFIRGFISGFSYRNGLRDYSEGQINMDTVETVEVLKGPASVQFGVNGPGGIVNYTTKKPQAETMRSFKVRFDEHGEREAVADVTGAVEGNSDLLYRVIVAGEDSEGYRDHSDSKGFTVAPSLTYLMGDDTRFNAALEVNRTNNPVDRGLPAAQFPDGTYRILDVSKKLALHEDNDTSVDKKVKLDLSLEHRINNDWRGEVAYSYNTWDSSWHDVQVRMLFVEDGTFDGAGFPLPVTVGDTIRNAQGYISREETVHQLTGMLHGDLNLAGMRHKLTVGADFSDREMESVWGTGATQMPPLFNVFDPVYGQINSNLTFDSNELIEARTWGLFASDTAYVTDRLIANVALRYNDYDMHETWDDGYDAREEDSAVVGNAGLLFKVVPEASLYLSYANSYEPNESANVIGSVEPTEGKQWEVGVKGLAMDNSLQYSLVYFDITKSNIPETVELDGRDMTRLVGEQTSRGVELDAAWRVNEQLTMLATYTYLDAEISKDLDEPELEGNTPAGQPEHTASLFGTYDLDALDPNLSMSLGVRYYDEVPNRNDNALMLPSYTRVDLGFAYDLPMGDSDSLKFKLGVKNLTDEDIFITQNKSGLVAVGTTRTVYGAVDYRF